MAILVISVEALIDNQLLTAVIVDLLIMTHIIWLTVSIVTVTNVLNVIIIIEIIVSVKVITDNRKPIVVIVSQAFMTKTDFKIVDLVVLNALHVTI